MTEVIFAYEVTETMTKPLGMFESIDSLKEFLKEEYDIEQPKGIAFKEWLNQNGVRIQYREAI